MSPAWRRVMAASMARWQRPNGCTSWPLSRAVLGRLERHYRALCDVEFTVSAGRLYILQTRIGRRSPLAAVRIAVEMAEDPDFPLTRAEAVARVDADVLRQVAGAERVDPEAV